MSIPFWVWAGGNPLDSVRGPSGRAEMLRFYNVPWPRRSHAGGRKRTPRRPPRSLIDLTKGPGNETALGHASRAHGTVADIFTNISPLITNIVLFLIHYHTLCIYHVFLRGA